MSKVYRFTGPAENWLTGIQIKKWAVNSNNVNIWNRLEAGDIALFHSTRFSQYSSKTKSVIVGYAVIGEEKWTKNDLWWSDEIEESTNKWPYVFSLKEIYLFNSLSEINLEIPVHKQSHDELKKQIEMLSNAGVPVSDLDRRARLIDPSVKKFPVNGSASGVRLIHEDLLLKSVGSFYSLKDDRTEELESNLAEAIDSELQHSNLQKIFSDAESYKSSDSGYVAKEGVFVVRRDNEVQKRRVAIIEGYTCQVCEFNSPYVRKSGKEGWIIDVDHIVDKRDGGTEELKNLWVLCPNCHRKKTRGVITINPATFEVKENGQVVEIRDSHLLV